MDNDILRGLLEEMGRNPRSHEHGTPPVEPTAGVASADSRILLTAAIGFLTGVGRAPA